MTDADLLEGILTDSLRRLDNLDGRPEWAAHLANALRALHHDLADLDTRATSLRTELDQIVLRRGEVARHLDTLTTLTTPTPNLPAPQLDLPTPATTDVAPAGQYPCPEPGCDRVFTRASALGRHRTSIHRPATPRPVTVPTATGPLVLACADCPATFETTGTGAAALNTHTIASHARRATPNERRPTPNTHQD